MDTLALYIHWPFCVSKCPYCDFNSHVRDTVDQLAWRDALLTDMAYEAAQTSGRQLTSIFFGGGTPSLMPPETVAALIEAAEHHWGFADDIEITLEDGVLHLQSHHSGETEEKDSNYYVRERVQGKWARSVQLPIAVNEENIQAVFTDGILKISLEKQPDKKAHKIEVK